jgi:hypothetical protein
MKILLSIFLALTSLGANAMGNMSSAGISGVYIRESRVDVVLTAPHNNPTGCPIATELVILNEAQNFKIIVAAILAAHLAGRKISGWIADCNDGRARITAIFVENQ